MRHVIFACWLALLIGPTRAANYTDWWADTSVAGSSVNVAQQGDTVFFAWYLYGDDRTSKWIYGAGRLADRAATVDLFEATGPFRGSTAQVLSTKVGTARLNFLSTGSLEFRFDTSTVGSGTLSLRRFTFEPLPLSGNYQASYAATRYNCPSGQQDATTLGLVDLAVSVSGAGITIIKYEGSTICTYSGTYTQYGSRFEAVGTYSCNSGWSGSWGLKDGLVDDGRLLARMDVHINGGCDSRSHVAAILKSRL